jgi:dihydrolipoamide dehydrogenase
VQVTDAEGKVQQVRAARVIIATGSVDGRIPVPGLDLPGVINSEQTLELAELPNSIAIIGGGVEGIEFASLFNALGCKVTVVEMMPTILPMIDDEVARRLHQLLRMSGVNVVVDARARGIAEAADGLKVSFETKKGAEEVVAERVLVAVGRRPNGAGVAPPELGLALNRSAVVVDDRLQTNLPGVYAIGDVTGRIMVAHVASYDGEVAVENALGHHRTADYRSVPNCVFAIPEVATVGLSEKQARETGMAVKITKFPLSASGRASTMGQTNGLVKMICEEGTGKLLGLHVLGPHASDIIAEAALAIRHGLTAADIADTIHSHPTLPEMIHEAALAQSAGAIHFMRM